MKAKYIILAVAALAALSCNKFEKLSQNPYALETGQGKAESFVQPMLYKTEYNLASVFRSTTAHLMQYAITTTSDVTSRIVANYNIPEGTSDDVWSGLYIQFGNARKMYEAAVREDSKSMQAVALVMQSMLISLITDTYGDVPFEDAGQIILSGAEANKYTTVYDSQKDIYRSIIRVGGCSVLAHLRPDVCRQSRQVAPLRQRPLCQGPEPHCDEGDRRG